MLDPDPKPWSYVGNTSQSLNDRAGGLTGQAYIKKESKFGFAIETYGWPNFQREILEDGLTEEEAREREKYWIQYYDSIQHGFNVSVGGYGNTGVKASSEKKQKLSKAAQGKYVGVNNPMYGVPSPMKGKHHTPEVRKKISELKFKPIAQYSLEGNFIAEYPSINAAVAATGICQAGISYCAAGHRKSAGGFHWAKLTN